MRADAHATPVTMDGAGVIYCSGYSWRSWQWAPMSRWVDIVSFFVLPLYSAEDRVPPPPTEPYGVLIIRAVSYHPFFLWWQSVYN